MTRDLILRCHLSPGDIVMLTAAVRDLHEAHPGQFRTDVRTSVPPLWENNPYLTPLLEEDACVQIIPMEYELIHQSNAGAFHFIHGFHKHLEGVLGVRVPVTKFKGDIHLSESEKSWMSQVEEDEIGWRGEFWIMVAGGKYDFTAKWWDPSRYQKVVDHFAGRIQFVQCGEAGHWHPRLEGVIDLVGQTDTRQFVRLMYHASGIVCPVTFAMHLAAAVETKPGRPKNRPCVVVAGGREPSQWEKYGHHRFLDTNGALPCCDNGGCWKSRCQPVGDGDEKDRPENLCLLPVQVSSELVIPRCMDMITADDVIRSIEQYLQGGALFGSVPEALGEGLRNPPDADKRANWSPHDPVGTAVRTGPHSKPLADSRPELVDSGRPMVRLPRLYARQPTVGLVIGTYAAVPYIHLQLEARKRCYPHVPVLVHDDGSGRREDLRGLCAAYGADFETNATRQPPCLGDLTVFAGGLAWARKRRLDLLLKISRRWVFRTDWTPSLVDLAQASQYATLGSYTTTFNFGFRSECLALSVAAWSQPLILEELLRPIRQGQEVFVEGYLHGLARRLEDVQCEAAEHWRLTHLMPPDKAGYALWRFMGTDRCTRLASFLWHDSHSPVDYRDLAVEWGLPYDHPDFVDPNQGEGDRVQPATGRSASSRLFAKPSLTVILVTIGRPTLERTLASLRRQRWLAGDEVLLVHDGPPRDEVRTLWGSCDLPGRLIQIEDGPHADWAATPRSRVLPLAQGEYVLYFDDDDSFAPDALDHVRDAICKSPGAIFLFQMRYVNGRVLWSEPRVACGNGSTQMIVHPREIIPGDWGQFYVGDFQFIAQTVERNPDREVQWVPQVIALIRHEWDDMRPGSWAD